MPKIKYESINFSQRSLKIIQQAESIVTDYKAKGYDLWRANGAVDRA
jgi:hypothetical protein